MQNAIEIGDGIWHIHLNRAEDERGFFVKTHADSIIKKICNSNQYRDHAILAEEFYSVSKKNVIRGMHFQTPPHDHAKIVYCPVGRVQDVMLDLRKGQQYGKTYSVVLEGATPSVLLIPRGIAHGFLALEDNSLMVYKTSSEYAPTHDTGILWNSFDFDWPCSNPIVSARDMQHERFSEFQSPFVS